MITPLDSSGKPPPIDPFKEKKVRDVEEKAHEVGKKAISIKQEVKESYNTSKMLGKFNAIQGGLTVVQQILVISRTPMLASAGFGFGLIGFALGVPLGISVFVKSITTCKNLVSVQVQLNRAQKTGNKTAIAELEIAKQNLQKALFGTLKSYPPILLSIATGAIDISAASWSLAHTVAPVALASISLAAQALGCAAGGVTALIGLVKTGLGIHRLVTTQKEINNLQLKLDHLENDTHASEVDKTLLTNALEVKQKQLKNERIRAFLKVAAGILITTAGVLAIAAACSTGWGALALALVGVGATVTVIGVSILSTYLKNKAKKMRSEVAEIPTQLTIEQQQLYAQYLHCKPDEALNVLNSFLKKQEIAKV